MSSYDVIVIGSGAGGGTLVRHLAPSGKRVLHSFVGENDAPIAGCAHQPGTCRFGADPQTSVPDVRRMGAQAAQREPVGDETGAPVRR